MSQKKTTGGMNEPEFSDSWVLGLAGFAGFVFVLVLLVTIFVYAPIRFYSLLGMASVQLSDDDKTVALISLAGVALWASVIRTKSQLAHGYIETAVGIVSAWVTVSLGLVQHERTTNGILLAGSAYIVSRGMTNVAEGLQKRDAARAERRAGEMEHSIAEQSVTSARQALERSAQLVNRL